HQPSVLETAVKSGFYLGPIPNTPNHRELRDALTPDSVNEVYVTVVTVSDRPSLVWLIAGFEQSLDLTRRADEIALLAGRALARQHVRGQALDHSPVCGLLDRRRVERVLQAVPGRRSEGLERGLRSADASRLRQQRRARAGRRGQGRRGHRLGRGHEALVRR